LRYLILKMNQSTEIKIESEFDKARQWFAIQTYTLKEQIAKANLENQGFKVYLPEEQIIRKHARRIDFVNRAFFPGYLFLHLSLTERIWQTIASTRGVIRPIRFGEFFPPVPNWVIEDLRSYENKKGLITFKTIVNENLKTGDKVKVNLPNTLEKMGVFKALRSNERALILLDILNRPVPTVVPLSSVSLL
jgi:transcriptional antiterminator RfaH